jgi:hypothetical protein
MFLDDTSLKCKASTALDDTRWAFDQPVDFMYMPSGIHQLNCAYNGSPIAVTVEVDSQTARVLQRSFESLCADEEDVFADEDHSERQATLRLPAGRTRFYYGSLRGHEGVVCSGATPTNRSSRRSS